MSKNVRSQTQVPVEVDSNGNVIGIALGGGVEQQVKDAETPADLLAMYGNFSGVTGGDFITRRATSN